MRNSDILSKYNFSFSKKFGQNFIFDTNLLQSIVNDAGITKDTRVLEIGTGAGTLTKVIANNCKIIDTYEIDENLRGVLTESFSGIDNIHLYFEDFMSKDMSEVESRIGDRYRVVANLPYYITTPIIFKLLDEGKNLDSITIMVQREVADRIVAKPNTKNYGILSVILQTLANVKITRNVSRRMFTPVPNVDSAIVNISLLDKYNIRDKKAYSGLVHKAFAMRRKTLFNNLRSALDYSADEIYRLLDNMGLDHNIRAEALTIEEFVSLYKLIYEK